ncbi:MAG: hypothetical protein ABEI13_01890, partial [Candidatus Paceibacteria bacterium]
NRKVNCLILPIKTKINTNNIEKVELYPILFTLSLVIFVYHIFIIQKGLVVILEQLVPQSATVAGSPSTNKPIITRLINHPKKILEAFFRGLYVFSLFIGISYYTLVNRNYDRHLHISAGMVVFSILLFIFTDVILLHIGMGPAIIIKSLPIMLIPGAAKGLDSMDTVGIILAVFVLVSGIVIVFPGNHTGSISKTSTQNEIEGYYWIKDHRSDTKIVGPATTFKVARGLFGKQTEAEWGGGYDGIKRTLSYNYPWYVPKRSGSSLYVIDGLVRARAQHEKTENNPEPINRLHTFRLENNRIYSNGGLTIFRYSYVEADPQGQ